MHISVISAPKYTACVQYLECSSTIVPHTTTKDLNMSSHNHPLTLPGLLGQLKAIFVFLHNSSNKIDSLILNMDPKKGDSTVRGDSGTLTTKLSKDYKFKQL